jgi:N-acylneuraminate cytidylyltransferase
MINNLRVLALIPARGGSKGLPRKNILEVAGKPLIAWSIDAAKQSRYVDHIVLSSEDREIIEVAKKWGCDVPFVRPEHLATDESPTMDVVLHAMQHLPDYDLLVLLQATSPLRIAADIDACIEICARDKIKTCVSVTEAEKSPYWMYFVSETGVMQAVMGDEKTPQRRQDAPPVFILNGAVYVAHYDWLLQHKVFVNSKTIAYPMPKIRSLDIDTKADLILLNSILNEE